MTTPTATDEIRDFVDEVAAYFDDLPAEDRRELLEDLEQHLRELAVEDEPALATELTSPEGYADELRRSAGLPERGGRSVRWPRWRRWVEHTGGRLERLTQQPQVAAVLEFLPQLRPAWWIVRAWALLVLGAIAFGGGMWYEHVPVPGPSALGLLALAGGVALSVKAGLDGTDQSRPWRVVNAVAGIAAVMLFLEVATVGPQVQYVSVVDEEWEPPVLRHPDGEPITNLYLYDLDGEPLTDVLVHDGLGRPVEIGDLSAAGFEDIETVYRRDRFGVPIRHLYPLEQYLVEGDVQDEPERRPRPDPLVTTDAEPAGPDGQQPSPSPDPDPTASPGPDPGPGSSPTAAPEG